MPRSVAQALAWAEKQSKNPSQSWYRLCLNFVKSAYDFPSTGTADAGKAWDKSKKRHKGDRNPPAGALCYWETKSVADHVALSAGGGKVWTNDFCGEGKICLADIDDITRRWGCEYQGWAADYCGVYDLPLAAGAKPAPKPGFEPFPGQDWFRKAPTSPIIEAMAKRLAAEGCGQGLKINQVWETTKGKAYQCWQKKLGYTGRDADGWPGPTSWEKLKVPNS